MTNRITIEKISISGFRAYLKAQTFHLRDGNTAKSLAVYAPNAKGKSSLVDAFEYFLSEEGTLKRLGQRRAGTKAGPEALEHVMARHKEIASEVTISFREGNDQFSDTRAIAPGEQTALPSAAKRLLLHTKLDFIIRGHELRRFVEDRSPQDQYKDVSDWFSLSPLVEVQKHIREIRLAIKNILESNEAKNERLKDLRRITGNPLATWADDAILHWVNENNLKTLDNTLALGAFDKDDKTYKTLKTRKEDEDKRIGLDAIKAAIAALKAVYDKDAIQEDEQEKAAGSLFDFPNTVASFVIAKAKEQEEKQSAKRALFKEIWEAAETLFSDPNVNFDACPVCETPLMDTPKGNREHITVHLQAELAKLKSYREASRALHTAKSALHPSVARLQGNLQNLKSLLQAVGQKEDHPSITEIDKYMGALAVWSEEKSEPDSEELKIQLCKALLDLQDEHKKREAAQGNGTYSHALKTVDDLIVIREKLSELESLRDKLNEIYEALIKTETLIYSELRKHLQAMIDSFKDRVNEIYCDVNPDDDKVPGICLELEGEAKQPQLKLLVDTLDKEGLVPSGYLSDSQMHTLALSLRLAAIQMTNTDVPIIVLDDIVTSYDADHRKAIAGMLAKEFGEFQSIIVTHDERFFRYLQDHLPGKTWLFKRITGLDMEFGPRFHDHMVTDAMIKENWDSGKSAANEIRQAEEEWLLKKSREFGVSVRIRDVHRAHEYDRSELAIAIYKFLKETGIEIPQVAGLANSFILSIQKGELENFGSHFSENPQAWASLGDEQKRWLEFQEFCTYFVCECGHKKFKRPKVGLKKAVCAKCEKPFAFGMFEK